jgi:glutamyl-tRNA reductase
VRHLFAVAAGMHSRRFGEPEVLGQVRQAWRLAQQAQATSPDLDGIFRQAIDAARHIRLAIGTASQASLGVCARTAFDEHMSGASAATVRVLVVGAGDAARSVLEAFSSTSHTASDATSPPESLDVATFESQTASSATPFSAANGTRFALAITSRTDDRAERLANEFRATPVSWASREAAMCAADVVVFAAHTSTPLIRDDSARAIAEVRQTPSLWIDLGVPGNVQLTGAVPNVHVVRLNDLEGQQPHDRAVQVRAAAALQRELARFSAAAQRRRLGAQLADLEDRALRAVRDAIDSADDSAHAAPRVEAVARRVTRVLLRELSALQ